MNYDDLPAGRELDALVAEKVMEWKPIWKFKGFHYSGSAFSTSISAAGEVVEKMREASPQVQEVFVEEIEAWAYDYDRAVAQIRSGRGHYPDTMMKIIFPAPLAICRAALKAVGK